MIIESELEEKYKDRHYYLKLAKNYAKQRNFSDMRWFCVLAESTQSKIDELENFLPAKKVI